MFFPSGVGTFDNTLMLKRGGGGWPVIRFIAVILTEILKMSDH